MPTFAAARDTASLGLLRRWHLDRGTPSRAIVAITLVSLALLAFGALTRDGFATMVDYLSPVYWLFLTLSGAALVVLRRREPGARRPFRVPGYPCVPLVFIASSVQCLREGWRRGRRRRAGCRCAAARVSTLVGAERARRPSHPTLKTESVF